MVEPGISAQHFFFSVFCIYTYVHKYTHVLAECAISASPTWETGTSRRLRRIIKRRHRREQLSVTDWFMYTNTKLSALKYHHHAEEKKKKKSIISLNLIKDGEWVWAEVLQNLRHFQRELCVVSESDMWWKPCFFTVYCLLSELLTTATQAIMLALSRTLNISS